VSWSGQDDTGGSGIASYDIYVSDKGGPFTLWQSETTGTSAAFTGVLGHTYGFYSVATDNVGNVQPVPSSAQATTRLAAVGGPPTSAVNPLPATTTSTSFTVSWSGSPGPGATSITSYEIFVSDDGGPFTPFLAQITATSATFTGQFGHTYGFYSVATDNLGDVQPTPTIAQATTSVTVPPSVVLSRVLDVTNKKHQVTEVLITFSGAVNATEADSTAIYRLTLPGKHGSYTAKNARTIPLGSASYSGADDTVTLIPKKPFKLAKPVQLFVDGLPPSGLQDSLGRLIDGDHDGRPGGNAVAVLTRSGVSLAAVAGGWLAHAEVFTAIGARARRQVRPAIPAGPLNRSDLDRSSAVHHERDVLPPDGPTAVSQFHHRLGDVTGDGVADSNDLNELAAAISQSAPAGYTPLDADGAGAGMVRAFDLTMTTRSRGRKLARSPG
jgi:hypothetical protein